MADGVFASTQRLVWRQGRPDDLEALHALACDFEVVRQTETWPWPADRAFTKAQGLAAPSADGVSGVITLDDQVIGFALVKNGGHLGYMLGREHWGRGYATEIGQAAVTYAFECFDWPQLKACVFTDNPASARVLDKLGFQERDPCHGPSAARGQTHPIRTFVLPRA